MSDVTHGTLITRGFGYRLGHSSSAGTSNPPSYTCPLAPRRPPEEPSFGSAPLSEQYHRIVSTVRNGCFFAAQSRMNFTARSAVTSELSPLNSTAFPLSLRTGSRSKKLGADTHSSNPHLPGVARPSFCTEPRCHFPKWPVRYPAAFSTCARVVSCGRIGCPHLNVAIRFGVRPVITLARVGEEQVEPDRLLRHRVEVRRLQVRVAVVGHVTPALIVGHHEHDVGLLRGVRGR